MQRHPTQESVWRTHIRRGQTSHTNTQHQVHTICDRFRVKTQCPVFLCAWYASKSQASPFYWQGSLHNGYHVCATQGAENERNGASRARLQTTAAVAVKHGYRSPAKFESPSKVTVKKAKPNPRKHNGIAWSRCSYAVGSRKSCWFGVGLCASLCTRGVCGVMREERGCVGLKRAAFSKISTGFFSGLGATLGEREGSLRNLSKKLHTEQRKWSMARPVSPSARLSGERAVCMPSLPTIDRKHTGPK